MVLGALGWTERTFCTAAMMHIMCLLAVLCSDEAGGAGSHRLTVEIQTASEPENNYPAIENT